MKVIGDIQYGTRHELHYFDLYLPSGELLDTPRPCLIFIHGGGWRTGDKSEV